MNPYDVVSAKLRRAYRTADGLAKECLRCHTIKPLTAFAPRHDAHRGREGRQSKCRECQKKWMIGYRKANGHLIAKRHRERVATDPAYKEQMRLRAARNHRRCKYGVTDAEAEQLLIAQGNKCAICPQSLKLHILGRSYYRERACFDHDHATGRLRGILCNRCNRALGLLTDDVTLLARTITYLNAGRDLNIELVAPARLEVELSANGNGKG